MPEKNSNLGNAIWQKRVAMEIKSYACKQNLTYTCIKSVEKSEEKVGRYCLNGQLALAIWFCLEDFSTVM